MSFKMFRWSIPNNRRRYCSASRPNRRPHRRSHGLSNHTTNRGRFAASSPILPVVTIDANDGVGNTIINHAVAQTGLTLSGNVTGLAAGSTFAILVADGSFSKSFTATVNAAGTGWTAAIPRTDALELSDGTLTVSAQVTDQTGHTSALVSQTFTVAETLPTVTIGGDRRGQ